MIFFGGVTLSLSTVGAEGVGSGKGVWCPPLRKIFAFFLFQNGEFLCMPNLT